MERELRGGKEGGFASNNGRRGLRRRKTRSDVEGRSSEGRGAGKAKGCEGTKDG